MGNYEAFVLALRLAITAPTTSEGDRQSQECINIAEQIAPLLTPDEISRAKDEATRGTNLRMSDSMLQQSVVLD